MIDILERVRAVSWGWVRMRVGRQNLGRQNWWAAATAWVAAAPGNFLHRAGDRIDDGDVVL